MGQFRDQQVVTEYKSLATIKRDAKEVFSRGINAVSPKALKNVNRKTLESIGGGLLVVVAIGGGLASKKIASRSQ